MRYPFLFLYDDKYHTVPLARETGRTDVHRRQQAQPLAHGEPHGSLKHGGAMPAVRQPRITRLPRGQKRGLPVSPVRGAWGIRRLPVSTPNRAPESTASRAREIGRAWGIRHLRGAAPSSHSLALRIAFWKKGPLVPRLPAVAGHRISNRHPCRLETTLSPCASMKLPLLIVTNIRGLPVSPVRGAWGIRLNLSVFPSYHGSPVTDHWSPIRVISNV